MITTPEDKARRLEILRLAMLTVGDEHSYSSTAGYLQTLQTVVDALTNYVESGENLHEE